MESHSGNDLGVLAHGVGEGVAAALGEEVRKVHLLVRHDGGYPLREVPPYALAAVEVGHQVGLEGGKDGGVDLGAEGAPEDDTLLALGAVREARVEAGDVLRDHRVGHPVHRV